MKKQIETGFQRINIDEQVSIHGGGDKADLAYNIVFFGLTSNPLFWMAKYSVWAIEQVL